MAQTTSKNTRKGVYHLLSNALEKTSFQAEFILDRPDEYKQQLFSFADSFKTFAIFQNNYPDENGTGHFIAAIGVDDEIKLCTSGKAWSSLKQFTNKHQGRWIACAMSYDLKNDIEETASSNENSMDFPEAHFFLPELLIHVEGNKVFFSSADPAFDAEKWQRLILGQKLAQDSQKVKVTRFEKRPDRSGYIDKIETLLEEIRQGNIYEVNYCRELLVKREINPVKTALALAEKSPSPFSVFYKTNDKYLICASPERFLLKNNSTLVSQPIKGTAKRSSNPSEDDALKVILQNDAKERAENVMIVDLVRNDLSRSAKRGTVSVSELFGVYSFPHVHQMISTVQSELNDDTHFMDALKYCFPMGSMTGAPKLRAMTLIEEHEFFKRGMFSGSLGLISPDQDFDFNVVIRSILYDSKSNYISIRTGSAITALCTPQKEWLECELKAAALINALRI